MLIVFSPIFVADTKIIFGDNFVAPLMHDKFLLKQMIARAVWVFRDV